MFYFYYVGEGIRGDDTSSAEALQYDFSTIREATDNFSIDNKLGQGGFGPVYKVIILGYLLVHELNLHSVKNSFLCYCI